MRRRQAAGGGAGDELGCQLRDGCCGQTCLHLVRSFQIGDSEDGGRAGAGQLRSGGGEHVEGGWGELGGGSTALGEKLVGPCGASERVGLSDVAVIVGALVLDDCGSGHRSA